MIPGPAEASRSPLLAVLEHVADEGPGLLGEIAVAAGVAVRRFGPRDLLPELEPISALVVMGGPQAAYEPEERLSAEVALLHEGLTRGLPILGVCLGAQLLAAACGAPVRAGERGQELGLGTVSLTGPGRDDPVFARCGEVIPVLHWHGDTFELPRGASHLASSEAYANQGFRLGRAYGFQFHLEVDDQLLRDWRRHIDLPADAASWQRRTEPVRRGILERWLTEALMSVR